MMRTRSTVRIAGALMAIALSAGCAATVKELRHHPQQARLQHFLEELLPHTEHPEKHYWVRVADPSADRIGLAVLAQRHIYLAQPLMEHGDDAILRALIAHAVAHHRLHHYTQRGIATTVQQAAFKVGGAFVPGLSHAHHVGGPLTERLISPKQESSADDRTIEYLQRMGQPAEDFARALEWMAERDFAERIGHTTSRGNTLMSRAARVRTQAASRVPGRGDQR